MAIEKTLINKATYESKMDELKAALDNYSNPEAVHLNDTQTITGLKTFATLPQAGTDPSNDADFIPKKYVDDIVSTRKAQEEKCYQALKTVTKDFTRTDPVYVRIGEDGEPEIHYTMTQADGSSYFANMDLGNATIYVHNGKITTSVYQMFGSCLCNAIYLDATSATSLEHMFSSNDPAVLTSAKTIGVFDTSKATNINMIFYRCYSLQEIPAFDFSNVTAAVNYGFYPLGKLTAFHAKGMRIPFDLSSTALKHDAILEVFNNLGSGVAEGTTLTLGSAKLALMSDEEKKIATDKGWTLA